MMRDKGGSEGGREAERVLLSHNHPENFPTSHKTRGRMAGQGKARGGGWVVGGMYAVG